MRRVAAVAASVASGAAASVALAATWDNPFPAAPAAAAIPHPTSLAQVCDRAAPTSFDHLVGAGEQRSRSRLVATASEDRLSFRRNSHTSFFASHCDRRHN